MNFKRVVIFASLLLFNASKAYAEVSPAVSNVPSKWRQCRETFECEFVQGSLCASETSAVIQKKFKYQWLQQLKSKKTATCGSGTLAKDWPDSESRKRCFEGLCQLIKAPRKVIELVSEKSNFHNFPDPEAIRRMFKRGLRDISMCYQWPNDDTDLPTGLIVIRFGIEKTGHAVAGEIKSSSLGNKTIETCALSAFLKQDFPNYEFSERMEIAIEFKLVDK